MIGQHQHGLFPAVTKPLAVFSLVFLAAALQGADPVIEALTVRQRAGSKLVDIDYTVSDADSQVLAIGVQAVNTETGEPIALKSLSGNTQVQPGSHRVTWDAGADWDGKVSNNLSFTFWASDDTARYVVIDISGGPTATSYPWTEGPVADWEANPEYKTSKIIMRKLPAGTFTMGSPVDELTHRPSEVLHQVTLTQPFYMGVFELTQRQWELVMGQLPAETDLFGQTLPVHYASWNDYRGGTWPNGIPASESFLGQLRAKTGLALDLPTAAQWEYACRAGTATAYNNGTDCLVTDNAADQNLEPLGWYLANADAKPHPVGLKQPNAWGLYDMHGNLFELCLDWPHTEPDGSPVTDPVGAQEAPEVKPYRVMRGGSFLSRARMCRSAYEVYVYDYYRRNMVGMRIACRVLTAE